MPTYSVDLTTERGVSRVSFTLDDDRPLGLQINHILEEFRQRGLVLKGGPEDELMVAWNGRPVDGSRTPHALGISPLHAIELRMRPRSAAVAARVEPPAAPFLSKTSYLALVTACTGAAIAWIVTATLFTDLGDVLTSYGTLDVVVATVLGAAVGGVLLGALARARSESVVVGLAAGIGLGAVGAAMGAFSGLVIAGYAGLGDSRQSFIVARLVTWALTSGFLGMFLAFRWVRTHAVVPFESLLWGCGAGIVGALLLSLPGPSDLWQLLAFLVVGAGTGAGVVHPVMARSLGIIELERTGAGNVGLLGHRGWMVPFHGTAAVGRTLNVRSEQGRCQVALTGAAAEPVTLGGRAVSGPHDLLNQDTITIGSRVFLYRRFPEAS